MGSRQVHQRDHSSRRVQAHYTRRGACRCLDPPRQARDLGRAPSTFSWRTSSANILAQASRLADFARCTLTRNLTASRYGLRTTICITSGVVPIFFANDSEAVRKENDAVLEAMIPKLRDSVCNALRRRSAPWRRFDSNNTATSPAFPTGTDITTEMGSLRISSGRGNSETIRRSSPDTVDESDDSEDEGSDVDDEDKE